MGNDAAQVALRGFDAALCVRRMCGDLPADPRLALGQIESATYLRNQLLRDSDWASMDHSVELRTPLVDAWLLAQIGNYLPSLARFPNKTLLAWAPAKPLPAEIVHRRKTGFGIPIERWRDVRRAAGRERRSGEWARELARSYEEAVA